MKWKSLHDAERSCLLTSRRPVKLFPVPIEPFERGFGITLGNASEWWLLSSIQGGGSCFNTEFDGAPT